MSTARGRKPPIEDREDLPDFGRRFIDEYRALGYDSVKELCTALDGFEQPWPAASKAKIRQWINGTSRPDGESSALLERIGMDMVYVRSGKRSPGLRLLPKHGFDIGSLWKSGLIHPALHDGSIPVVWSARETLMTQAFRRKCQPGPVSRWAVFDAFTECMRLRAEVGGHRPVTGEYREGVRRWDEIATQDEVMNLGLWFAEWSHHFGLSIPGCGVGEDPALVGNLLFVAMDLTRVPKAAA